MNNRELVQRKMRLKKKLRQAEERVLREVLMDAIDRLQQQIEARKKAADNGRK